MPSIERKELRQQLGKKILKKYYLLYGDEKMYIKTDTAYLVEKLMGKNPPDFNYHAFKDNFNLDEIAVAVQVAPFMSEYNCVLISDLDVTDNKLFPGGKIDRLIAILDNVPDGSIMIMSMPTLENDVKKASFQKLIKYFEKNGAAVYEKRETPLSLARQIIKWADSRGIKIEQADAYKLQEYVGTDLNLIKNELDKVCNYLGERDLITTKDIDLLVTRTPEADIYQLSEMIISGNGDKAYKILDVLLYTQVAPDAIVSVLGRAYMDFYRARVGAECGVPMDAVAKEFGYGNRAWVLGKCNQKTKLIPTNSLRDSLNAITEVNADMHSVSNNPRVTLENLIAKLLMYASEREQF